MWSKLHLSTIYLLAATTCASSLFSPQEHLLESREQRFDQMRLMACINTRGDSPRHDRLIGYYSHPPGTGEKPTQVAFLERNASPTWERGCDGHGKSTDGAEWKCDVPPFKWGETLFKQSLGTITYGYTGFNCFRDDRHATHFDDDGTLCYTELYCTHERRHSLAISASKATVKPEYRATVEEGKKPNIPDQGAKELMQLWLERIRGSVNEQICGADDVPLTTNCKAKVTCSGREPKYLTKLVDALEATYEHEQNEQGQFLYQGYQDHQCYSRPPQCTTPNHCIYLPDICDYVKGVEIPRRYVASLESKVPPNADENNGEITINLSTLDIEVTCEEQKSNDIFCNAMSTLFGGFALVPKMGKIFDAAGLVIEGLCRD